MRQNEQVSEILQELNEIMEHLPIKVQEDIQSRLKDWFLGEENMEEADGYVAQQLRYAKRVLEHGVN